MVNEQIIDISGPLKGEIEVPGDKSMTSAQSMLAPAEGVIDHISHYLAKIVVVRWTFSDC